MGGKNKKQNKKQQPDVIDEEIKIEKNAPKQTMTMESQTPVEEEPQQKEEEVGQPAAP
jgi:hypothetical protein